MMYVGVRGLIVGKWCSGVFVQTEEDIRDKSPARRLVDMYKSQL